MTAPRNEKYGGKADLLPYGGTLLTFAKPRHTATVLLCVVAVGIVSFANSTQVFRLLFFGIFALAILVPHLARSSAPYRKPILLSILVFAIWNLIVLLAHPLDENALYNGLLAVACVLLFHGFTRLSPESGSIVAFVHQVGWVVRVLLVAGAVSQLFGHQLNWGSKTGTLWLLLFFVFIDPKVSRFSKCMFLGIWYFQAYVADDRAYLFIPVIVCIAYLSWPTLGRVRALGGLVFGGFFVVLALFPVVYVQLSVSEYRSELDQLALRLSGGRFFSGRDLIWRNMLDQVSEHGILTGGGQAISPSDVFLHNVSAHNTFISVLARTGLVGLVLLALVFAATFITYGRNLEDPVTRWSVAFAAGILVKQSSEMSLLGNNVAIATLSWLVISFGFIHLNSSIRDSPPPSQWGSAGHPEEK